MCVRTLISGPSKVQYVLHASFWKRPFMLTDQQPDHILVHTWLRGKTVDNKTVFKLRASDIGFLHAAVEREKGRRD